MTPESVFKQVDHSTAPTRHVGSRWLSALSLVALTLVPLGTVFFLAAIVGAAMAFLAGFVAIRVGDWPTVRVSTLAVLLATIGGLRIPFSIWLVVGIMWFVGRKVPGLIPGSGWLPRGSSSPGVWWLGAITVIGAAVALAVWAGWTEQFADGTVDAVDAVRQWPLALLIPAVGVFAFVNAITEEIAYRGIVYETACALFPPTGAVIVQAAAFGALHVAGFPAGPVGVGLAFAYGLALGALRYLTGGLRIPIVVHVAADATIAVLAITLANTA